jgi:hypothetical protein
MDVAIDPNSKGGKWLTGYLSQNGIPYIPMYHAGQMASGPHIHVGQQSRKLDALDSVLDTVPAAPISPKDETQASSVISPNGETPAPAGDELDNLLSTLPVTDEHGDEVGQANASSQVAPSLPPAAPQTFDPYTVEGRAARDAQTAAESQPNAVRSLSVQLPAEYSKLTPREVAEMAVRSYAKQQGIGDDFASAWLKSHPEVNLYGLRDVNGKTTENLIDSPSFDPQTRTLRVGAQMPFLSQLKKDFDAQTNALGRGVAFVTDDKTTAGEKAGDVASAGAHALDVVTRPLQAASTVVAGEQRAAGAMIAAPFSQSARDVLKSGIYEPNAQIAAALHKLKTGETPAGYEQPVAEGLDLLSQLYRKEPLNPLVKEAVALGFDPLTYVPLEGAHEFGASVLSRASSVAARIAEDLPGARRVEQASRALTDLRDPRVDELFNSGGRVLDLRPTPKDADHFFVTIQAGDGSMVKVDTRTGEFSELGDSPHHSNFQPRESAGTFKAGSPALPVDRGQPLPDYLSEMTGQPTPELQGAVLPTVTAHGITSRVAQTASDIINLPKSLKSSFALHGVFRQGIFQGASHPTFLKDAIATQARAFASESAFQDFARSIAERADFPLMRDSGLFLPSTYDVEMAGHAPAAMREERFASNVAEKIPGVRRSSRAHSAAMDSLRVQAWDNYTKALAKNPSVTDDTYKALADLINVTTGRGTIPILDRSATGRKIVTLLNNPLWSPRAMASRFNMLSPYRLIENSINPATRPVALLQLKDSMRALMTVGTTMGLLSQVPGVEVGLNPFGKNWGKVSIGNTHYDLVDGVPATARYVAQMSRAFYQMARDKKPQRGQDPTSLTKDFLRRRLSPSGQVVADYATGKTVQGDPFSYSGAARDLAVPFVLDGLYQAWLDAGGSSVGDVVSGKPVKTAFRGALKGVPSVVGIPSSTYEEHHSDRGGSASGIRPRATSAGPPSAPEDFHSVASDGSQLEQTLGEVLPPDRGAREIADPDAQNVARLLDGLNERQIGHFVKGLGEFEGMGVASPLADAASYAGEYTADAMGNEKAAGVSRAMRQLARESRLRPQQFYDDVLAGRYGQSLREKYGQNYFSNGLPPDEQKDADRLRGAIQGLTSSPPAPLPNVGGASATGIKPRASRH